MKYLFITLSFLISTVICFAQSRHYEKTISKLSSEANIKQMSFSKEAFGLLTYFDISMKEELKNIIDDIEQMKIITASTRSRTKFYDLAEKNFKDAGYSSVDLTKYGNIGQSKAFIKSRFIYVREAHFVVDYGQGAVISFFGKFRMRDIRKLIKGADKVGATSVGN